MTFITIEILKSNGIRVINNSEWGKNTGRIIAAVEDGEGFIITNFLKGFKIKIHYVEELKYVY